MKHLIVGSYAAKNWFPDFRDAKDIDVFTDDKEQLVLTTVLHKTKKLEAFWHPALNKYLFDGARIATPNELYTIKVSHAFWNINWNKHMADVLFFQKKGAKLIPELYDLLYSVWEDHYGKKKANLNVDAADFFKSTVTRVYEHDSIHASVAYYDEPLFNRILKDGATVAVDRSKFEAMSLEDKYKLVREEVYATALERLVIPSDYKYSPRAAYAWALNKTITSFSKGWFPLFIVTHFQDLMKPDIDYVKKHKDNSDKLIKLGATA